MSYSPMREFDAQNGKYLQLILNNALEKGRRIKMRDRFDEVLQRWSYAYEGNSIDGDSLRVIVTFIQKLAVVTVVKLGEVK